MWAPLLVEIQILVHHIMKDQPLPLDPNPVGTGNIFYLHTSETTLSKEPIRFFSFVEGGGALQQKKTKGKLIENVQDQFLTFQLIHYK